jgi:glycine cleavage system aminomethyltransferase T
MATITPQTLEQKINAAGNPVELLRNSPIGPYVFPIPAEFSNWRDEQEASQKTAVLYDQSYHMTDLYLEGRDVVRLLSDLGVNSFAGFGRNKAKQMVVCSYGGYVIGDSILFGLEDHKVNVVGRPPVPNWVEYHAKSGKYDVRVERDERTVSNPRARRTYRFQVQGPNAFKILERANGAPLPEIKFFSMGEISIAGRGVRALRHGMAGAPGLEVWGPVEEGAEIKAALLDAGQEFGLKQAGARAYATTPANCGWIPSPLPAIYTGEKMKPYREWLKADSFEAMASLGGSFDSSNIEDYYLTPWDLGYGGQVKFDHDFVGREALEKRAEQLHRKKVTLIWNSEDVVRVFATMFQESGRAKFLEMPASHYSAHPYDIVLKDGKAVGLSTYSAYMSNGGKWISLAILEERQSALGTEVSVVWGEKDGGSAKPVVERHVQTQIRATVSAWPYAASARAGYRPYESR